MRITCFGSSIYFYQCILMFLTPATIINVERGPHDPILNMYQQFDVHPMYLVTRLILALIFFAFQHCNLKSDLQAILLDT